MLFPDPLFHETFNSVMYYYALSSLHLSPLCPWFELLPIELLRFELPLVKLPLVKLPLVKLPLVKLPMI